MDECLFTWSADDGVTVNVCTLPKAGHPNRHVTRDGTWILVVSEQLKGSFGQPIKIAEGFKVTDPEVVEAAIAAAHEPDPIVHLTGEATLAGEGTVAG